ncbi:hypothetical protein [Nocardia phage NBR1]|uniref:hypothetical protein n=1 Tax=Nocardia phage NBR1 TaxID=1109711 RepID=UPI00023EEDE0|nr:hypothetical protein NoPhNBR1_gp29 [Nocardia phage NBR1]AEV52242.1 hypothetical protein [Nocardia phage NBR1]
MTQRNKPRREPLACTHPSKCDKPRYARKLCQEHYLAAPVIEDPNTAAASRVRHHAKLMADQLQYIDFTAERSGQRIVLTMPNAEDIGLFLSQMGWRLHADEAVMKRSTDADGQPVWVPTDAPDVERREFPIPDLEGRDIPVEALDALEAAVARARARAKDLGVDLSGTPDNAG